MILDPWSAFHVAVSAVLGLVALGLLRDLAWVKALPPLDPRRAERPPPRVSVVIPARDEGLRVDATLRRVLAQVGVDLEVIVVDDRSRDETGAIARALAREDPRVRLVTVESLPAGWLGKPHACQRGGESATGDWILFTDGDVWMRPDVIARAVALAEREGVEHVTLAPRCAQSTFLARVAVNAFATGLTQAMARANRDSRFRQVGIGAFNLVRREAWVAIGGHGALAFEVVDDLRLGLLLRRGGFRTRAALALEDVEADWGGTLSGVFHALEKNLFAEMRYRVTRSCAVIALLLALFVGAASGPWFGTPLGWCAFAALASLSIPSWILARRAREGVLVAIAIPLGFPILAALLAHSMARTLARGGVTWRGTLYPLSELRARRVR